MHETTAATARIRPLFLVLSGLLVAGCADLGADPLDPTDRAGQSDISEPPAHKPAELASPVFYEADEWGQVVGGPVPDDLDTIAARGDLDKNPGSRPIHVQKYGPFGNGGTLSTGFPTSNWVATVVGIQTTDGDINEVGSGNPLYAYPFQHNGIWHVSFDLRSHGDNESWSVWVMYIQRTMASTSNF